MVRPGYVYIMANQRNGTIYLGVTSNLRQRVWQHRESMIEGFTKERGCKMLVWYSTFDDIQDARMRELQMKKWKRIWKLRVIEKMNPDWNDLYETLF
ncbi:MAG: GIY-YIG nuclease family protein [Sphingomonadaceae bacterium]